MTSGYGDFVKRFASVSLGVDMTNTKEVEMLKEVLVAWPEEMGELEIFFKVRSFHVSKYNETTLTNFLSSITFVL